MNSLLLLARLSLAAIFVTAALAKLADLGGTREALKAFGAPAFLVAPLGPLIPVFELATAIALIPIASAWWGGVSALFLLLVFISGISVNLAQGRHPDCHCFGQLHSAPARWQTLVRNGVLACVALLIVWSGPSNPGPSALGWLGDLTLAQRTGLTAGIVGFVIQGFLLFGMLRQQGRILLRLEKLESLIEDGKPASSTKAATAPAAGLPLGVRAPSIPLKQLRGEAVMIDVFLGKGKPLLLLFTNPNCGPCQALMPDIGRWQREHAALLTVALVSEGSAEENRLKNTAQVSNVLLQERREMAEAYRAWGTPAGVIVRTDGTVGSHVAQGADAIRALVADNVRAMAGMQPASKAGTKIGAPAPALELMDLDGKSVALTSLRDRKTLILFWNPGCGFCQRMLPDLKQWDSEPPLGAPSLVVLSAGTSEENRAMGLRSPILIDQNFQAGAAFGATGTPMALLLDEKGQIASDVAAGAQAVFALAGGAPLQKPQF